MRKFNTAQWIFFGVVVLAFTYFASGYICILLNKVPLLKSFEHYNIKLPYTMIVNNYPYAWKAVGIAFFISVIGILVMILMPEKENIHGKAKFANSYDVRKMGLFSDKGIIVGKYGGKLLRFKGQQFVSVGAPTRSGKGVGIVIPNLIEWQDSCVILDIKQECYDYTSGYRQKVLKQDVYLFNPFSPDRTHRYNPLTYIDMEDDGKADLQLTAFADILYPATGDGNTVFFSQQAQNLFIGLCYMNRDLRRSSLYEELSESYNIKLPFTMKGILDLSAGFHIKNGENEIRGFEETYRFFEECEILSNDCKERIEAYFALSGDTITSVMGSFKAPLLMFGSKTLNAATEESDFDLRDLRKKRMTIYIGITPDKLASAKLILNIFWSQLILENTQELPQKNSELKYPCLLLMDEFTAPGGIEILEKAVGFIAGYNLRLMLIFQSLSQLETNRPNGYGKEGAKTLISNIACQIVYAPAPNDIEGAERWSKIFGTKTVKSGSKSFSKSGTSKTENEIARALILPQELKDLKFEEEIIAIGSGKPIFCQKAIYFNDSYFMDKFKLIAPSLKLINGIPEQKQFEKAVLNGECRMTENFSLKKRI